MISKEVQENLTKSSWIRKMFVEGAELKAIHGENNVYDFSIGNPYFEPPKKVVAKLREIVNSDELGTHKYMDNAGFPDVRQKVAEDVNKDIIEPISNEHVMMTVGAAGGMNVIMRTILDPGQEVIIIAPYFAEYIFYIKNHNGVPVEVSANPNTFEPDLEALEAKITDKTRAIIINTPNNPTGVIYSEESLKALAAIVAKKEAEIGHEIFVISDEPYKAIIYDNGKAPNVHNIFKNSLIVNSYSKSLGLAGERIGYIAMNSKIEDPKMLMSGFSFANRTLGFVNAPALWQKVIADSLDDSVDIKEYEKRRDVLYTHLESIGFEMVKPDGAFYFFPKAMIEDDVAFVMEAKKYNLLLVPGSGFGYPGYFRISYCVDMEMIERSLPAFTKLAESYKNK